MNAKDKLKKLGEHFKVPQGSLNFKEWSEAVKKKAGKQYVALDVLYDDTFSPKKEDTSKPEKAKDGEVLPPVKEAKSGPVTVEGASHKVDVAAPNLIVNLAPPSVNVNQGAVTWAYTLQRAVQYVFVFGSGAMFGVLALLAKMKGIG